MKATQLVYWPGKPTRACDNHAEQLKNLGALLGVPIQSKRSFSDYECENCANEAKAAAAAAPTQL